MTDSVETPLPLEYRERVPEELTVDALTMVDTSDRVRGALSMMASDTDDPAEFSQEVVITYRDSRQGGCWVHGELGRPLAANYLDQEVPKSEYAFDSGEPAIIHDGVDFTPEQLECHMEEKRSRNGS